MTEPVRWGIVGYGWVAEAYMAPAILEAGHRLVAVADPDPCARARAEAAGARAVADLRNLADDPDVEAVYVATPNHLHRPAVERLAVAGKAVLCEKPMAATLADADAMAATVRRTGILYGTAFDQRFHPAHVAARDLVRAGAIGIPTAIRIAYACWVGRDWQGQADGDGQAIRRENWRVDAGKAGGGALIDLAPHGLDLAGFLLGEPVAAVKALTQSRVQDYAVDDGAVLVGATASGILLTQHVAYNCPEALPRRRLEIVGSAGGIVAENTMGQEPGGLLRVHDDAGRVSDVPFGPESPFTGQARAFAAALRGGDREAFSAERDLATMRLVEEAYRSAQPAAAQPAAEPAERSAA